MKLSLEFGAFDGYFIGNVNKVGSITFKLYFNHKIQITFWKVIHSF